MATINVFSKTVVKFALADKIEDIKRKIGRKEFMLKIGEEMKRLILGDTRRGIGVDGTKPIRLAKLKPSYVDWKKKNQNKAFSPGRFFRTDNRSNLTLTGQLLDSLTVDARQNFVRVYVRDIPRKGYGADVTNNAIAEWQANAGRPFMGLHNRNRAILDKEIERETRAIVRRELARK